MYRGNGLFYTITGNAVGDYECTLGFNLITPWIRTIARLRNNFNALCGAIVKVIDFLPTS